MAKVGRKERKDLKDEGERNRSQRSRGDVVERVRSSRALVVVSGDVRFVFACNWLSFQRPKGCQILLGLKYSRQRRKKKADNLYLPKRLKSCHFCVAGELVLVR